MEKILSMNIFTHNNTAYRYTEIHVTFRMQMTVKILPRDAWHKCFFIQKKFMSSHLIKFLKNELWNYKVIKYYSCVLFLASALDDNRTKTDFTHKNCTRIDYFDVDKYQPDPRDSTNDSTNVIPCEYYDNFMS